MKRLFLLLLILTPLFTLAANQNAYFAGGCFWCMQPPYDKTPGVTATTAGYINYVEVVKVDYDDSQVSYPTLLKLFWRNVDPTDAAGQFCDRGLAYRSGIYYVNDAQKKAAEKSKQALIASKRFKQVVTKILPAENFRRAADYHQNFYQKSPLRYKYYRKNCGRDQKLKALWK